MSKDNGGVLAKLDKLAELVIAERAENAKFRGDVRAEFQAVHLEFKAQSERIARVEGELRGLGQWLASMDQRFVAIMRPYEPPKPAA